MENIEDLFEYLFEEIENDEPPFKKQKINQVTNNINQVTNNINQLINIININLKNILL